MDKVKDTIRWWEYITSIFYVLFFILILLSFDIAMRIVRPFSYKAFRWVELGMCKAIRFNLQGTVGARFTFDFEAPIPKNVPCIVVSNHQCMYDVSLLDEILYEFDPRFISKIELGAWIPGVSFISRNNKTVLIDRNDRKQALNAMKQGASCAQQEKAALVIFPEGTRARDGKLQPFKNAGLLSLIKAMPEALLVPIVVNGTWKFLRYNFWPVPWGISVKISILPPQVIDQKDVGGQIQRIITLMQQRLESDEL